MNDSIIEFWQFTIFVLKWGLVFLVIYKNKIAAALLQHHLAAVIEKHPSLLLGKVHIDWQKACRITNKDLRPEVAPEDVFCLFVFSLYSLSYGLFERVTRARNKNKRTTILRTQFFYVFNFFLHFYILLLFTIHYFPYNFFYNNKFFRTRVS